MTPDLPRLNDTSFMVDWKFEKVGINGQEIITLEPVINRLREAEVLLSQGATLAIVLKRIGVSDCTYYRWRKEFGGMKVEQAKRLKQLEVENARLKRLVADLSLDKAILTEAARGNF